MYRKYFFSETVLILLLSHVGWNGPSTTFLSCSYKQSRIVQHVIQKKLLPILERYRMSLPLDCPFHKKRDVFGWPTKYAGDTEEHWTCPICGQMFPCEERFVTHWEDVHYVPLNEAEDAVCLADFCDIMRCEVLGLRLDSAIQNGWSVEDTSKSAKTHDAQKNWHSVVSSCDQEKMAALQNKCRAVVRQCTVGLLMNLSLKDFQDIEDELNKAVCSYLTCDKFWDDNLNETRHVPVLLCVIIGVIMIGGFCLCYYIVWILFDSPLPEELCCNGLHTNPLYFKGRHINCGAHYRFHRAAARIEHSELRNNRVLPRR